MDAQSLKLLSIKNVLNNLEDEDINQLFTDIDIPILLKFFLLVKKNFKFYFDEQNKI
jgi:hypothetical protein